MSKRLAVRSTKCASCPFRDSSEHENLRTTLAISATSERSRICHSTGSNAIKRNTGKPERLCRGARDLQLQLFRVLGFIEAATDEAWEKKCVEMGL